MIEIIDFSSWKVYEGLSEGSGRSEKVWLESGSGQIGLFKYPKIDPVTKKETTEHISEHLACQLGKILGIPTARVDIGIRDGRMGSLSYFVCEAGENLLEGIGFISGKYPHYNAGTMQNEEDKRYYCIEHILNSVPKGFSSKIWIEMMLFDFLIGNSDRHQSNWAILSKVSFADGIKISLRQCPLYDNGSSLCCYVNEIQLEDFLGKDTNRFDALVDSKSHSIIRIDGAAKNTPTHRNVAKYLLEKYPIAKDIAIRFVECLNEGVIDNLLSEYPDKILSASKNELIKRFLVRKIEILKALVKEVGNDVTAE